MIEVGSRLNRLSAHRRAQLVFSCSIGAIVLKYEVEVGISSNGPCRECFDTRPIGSHFGAVQFSENPTVFVISAHLATSASRLALNASCD